jgi:hypothetical protein
MNNNTFTPRHIDIEGIDKIALLTELWNNASYACYFEENEKMPMRFSISDAIVALRSPIDYFCGKCIKVDLSKDRVDPHGYNRDHGVGSFESIVENLKSNEPRIDWGFMEGYIRRSSISGH